MRLAVTLVLLASSFVAQEPPETPPVGTPDKPPVTVPSPAVPPAAPEPMVPVPVTVSVQPEYPYWGTVKGSKVRVRGGPGDFHSILQELPASAPVRVLAKEGDWMRVEIPGGVAVFVALSAGAKTYVNEANPGEGVVMVDDLMIRGDASTEFPPLGKLQAGERIMVLDKQDNFARILGPPAVKMWIHSQFILRGADQATTAAEFLARHKPAEEALLKSGVRSQELVAKTDEKAKDANRAKEAFDRFDAEKSKKVEERDTAATRDILQKIRDERPIGDPLRARAEEMLTTVQDWEATRNDIAAARERLTKAAKEAKAAEERYAEELKDLKKKREDLAEANRRGPGKPPYLAMGYVRLTALLPKSEDPVAAPFALYQGATTRRFIVESERYDLKQYADKMVGIIVAEGPEDRQGLSVKVLRISKMEILDGG